MLSEESELAVCSLTQTTVVRAYRDVFQEPQMPHIEDSTLEHTLRASKACVSCDSKLTVPGPVSGNRKYSERVRNVALMPQLHLLVALVGRYRQTPFRAREQNAFPVHVHTALFSL